MFIYQIEFAYDAQSGKFYVTRSDIVGLHAEADSIQELGEIICDIGPELIEANHVPFRARVLAMARAWVSPSSHSIPSSRGVNFRLAQDLCAAH